ncbi:MAG: phytanoyl-CoA dioxygenase family protein, partial [Myxococcota bacterium]
MSVAALSIAQMAESNADAFHRDGYLVLRGAVDQTEIDTLLERIGWLCERETGLTWTSIRSVSLARTLATRPKLRRRIVEQARVPAWLTNFAAHPALTRAAQSVLNEPVQLLRHQDLNLAPPMDCRSIGVWHQDHFYTRGSTRTLRAVVPLQD